MVVVLLSVVVFVGLVGFEQDKTRFEELNPVVEHLETDLAERKTVVDEHKTGFEQLNTVVEELSTVVEQSILRPNLFSMRPLVCGRPSDQLPRAVCPESPVRFPRMLADNKFGCFPVSTGFV